MPECDVCRELSGEIGVPGGLIWDTELVVGFHVPPLTEPTAMLGHLLITPRRHADTWAELSSEEAAGIGVAAAALGRALHSVTAAERLYSAVMGHHSPHFHLHLFPRYPGTPSEFSFLRVDEWEGSPKGDERQIAGFAERLRGALQQSA